MTKAQMVKKLLGATTTLETVAQSLHDRDASCLDTLAADLKEIAHELAEEV